MKQIASADYPPILFFYQANVAQGAEFFGSMWQEARAVSDEKRQFYKAMGIRRASTGQVFSPETLVCATRAALKGNMQGKTVGDVWVMPGLFLAEKDGRILWQHDFKHIGDHPDFARIADEVPKRV